MTLTFRRWARSRVVAGNHYRTAAGMLKVTALDTVDPDRISDREAQRAGSVSAAELVEELLGTPDLPTCRIEFRLLHEPDPRFVPAQTAHLSTDDVVDIDRLDRSSRRGPWTRAALQLIADHRATRAPDLAAMHGRDTQPFKSDVRKLKNLGLTISLDPGYRLSPRGETYVGLSTVD